VLVWAMSLKEKALAFYHQHELRFHIGSFGLGFIFDYFAAEKIDSWPVICHQIIYLLVIGGILSLEYLTAEGLASVSSRWQKVWDYRGLVLHFFLGTLLNLYSFFYLKSASIFTGLVFLMVLVGLVVVNELPHFRKSQLYVRWALWVLCIFSFFSMLFPLVLGFVGWLPFLLAASGTSLILYFHFRYLMRFQKNFKSLSLAFLRPGIMVIAFFVGFYFLGWIPPVPLAAKNFGIYHKLEKREGKFVLSYERPWWKFWQNGDQTFFARPGDSIYFFARIFSPAKFSDEVTIHWLYKEPRAGWITSDKVKMQINGGREQGFRGYSVKQNYQPGDWRVQVETTDGREIGRLYLEIIPSQEIQERVYSTVEFD
jgi:hypothetical protein